MNTPKIQVIIGSTRQGRQGDKVAHFFMDAVKDNVSAQIELVDLAEYDLPMFQDATPPMMREGRHDNEKVQKWLDKVSEADGYVFVTAEYNASIPAPLKNALDFGYKEWNGKYVGFVSYGALTAGVRAIEHLRLVTSHLRMLSISDKITIPNIWSAFDAEGNLAHGDEVKKTANAMIDDIAKRVSAEKVLASMELPAIATEETVNVQ